jgi:hypothetical protein
MKKSLLSALAVTSVLAIGCFFYFDTSRNSGAPPRGMSPEIVREDKVANGPLSAGPIAKSANTTRHGAGNFYAAKNLNAYISSLRAHDDQPGSIDLAQAKAIDECRALKVSPTFAADIVQQRKLIGHSDVAIVQKYADQLEERCLTFLGSQSISGAGDASLYSAAAEKGSLEAEAHLLKSQVLNSLVSPTAAALSLDSVQSSVVNIIGSGDPAAIFELSDLFGENSVLGGTASGSSKAVAAWQLVACDMGLDCSENLLRSYCLNGGIYCGSGDLRQNMQQTQFTPADFAQVVALESAIVSALNAGNVGSLFNQ